MAELEVSRVLGCTTHYQVLKLDEPDRAPVFVDVQQARRRYRELAILVHPDKNRATDAEAAFKRLSEAYDCLVDEPSQRQYLLQLQLHHPKTGKKPTKPKYKTKRKRKAQSVPKSGEGPRLPKRRRTPEEIWQEFQREEEEMARQNFHAKGFDRVYYESRAQRTAGTTDAASTTTTAPEEQQHILDSNLDEKASCWTKWSKPTSIGTRMASAVSEPAQEAGVGSTVAAGSDGPVRLVCCMLCRRKFSSVAALDRHETLSKLHLANLQAQQRQQSGDGP